MRAITNETDNTTTMYTVREEMDGVRTHDGTANTLPLLQTKETMETAQHAQPLRVNDKEALGGATMGTNEYKLSAEIVARSEATTWDAAKAEWKLERIYQSNVARTCLCTHNPIREICVLRNKVNNNVAEVGNCCVQKFMDIDSNKLFAALKRVIKDPTNPLNASIINLAHSQGIINDWEKSFYLDTWRKRLLSQAQMAKRVDINRKILVVMK